MGFEFFIGRRYLKARRKNGFISLITILSTTGVAVGVMVMIVVIAVMSGAETELRTRMLNITAHLVVMRHGGPFLNYQEPLETIRETPGITAATPYIYSQIMLRSSAGIFGAVLRGIDPETAGDVIRTLDDTELKQLSPSPPDATASPAVPGIILGSELADQLKVETGHLVSLVLPGGASSSAGMMPAMQRFQVVDTFSSGLYEFDKALAYVALPQAQKMLRMPGSITGIEARVSDIYNARAIGEVLVDRLGFPYLAQDWMQMNHNLFSALKLQKTVMFIILVLIIIVAAFNIASTLIMMVMEKTRDIAILKAMGATDWSIKKIFVYKGLVIGTVGTFFGLIAGFLLCLILSSYQFIELPRDVYFFTTLPVDLEFLDVLVITLSTIGICFFATLYPSRKAARLNPVEAFRYG